MGFLAAAAPAIATGVAGIFQAKKASDAAKAQERAQTEAFDWQKQQALQAQELYKQQYQDWLWGRNQLLQRYGLGQAPMPNFGGGIGQPPQAQAPPLGTMMQGGGANPPVYAGPALNKMSSLADLLGSRMLG